MRVSSAVTTGWVAVVVGAGALAAPTDLEAQNWRWPERAQNLQVLPADFPGSRLGAVMRGFTSALGVRCSYCHVGEEGQPLSEYDFASDANPNKERARVMYRMLGAVNDHLDEIEPSGEPVNMWCHTCHNGKPRPQTLAEAVRERYAAEGGDVAYAYFLELRDRYFGSNAYDFRARSVLQLAQQLESEGDAATAGQLVEHTVQAYPQDARAQESMGDVWLARGDTARAVGAYLRSLSLEARNPALQEKVEALQGR